MKIATNCFLCDEVIPLIASSHVNTPMICGDCKRVWKSIKDYLLKPPAHTIKVVPGEGIGIMELKYKASEED